MSRELQQFALDMPAQPEFVRIVRLIVAGLGNALCFNVDEIEDLKLAVGEACYQAFDSGTSHNSRLKVCSFLRGSGVEVQVSLSHQRGAILDRMPGLRFGDPGIRLTLLRHLVDELGFSSNDSDTSIRLIKRRLLN